MLGPNDQKASQTTCNREVNNYQIPKPSIYSSKEGLTRRETYSGSLNTQQVHQVPFIQNVNNESNSIASSKTFLDSFPRLKGWVLAHRHNQKEAILPRFQLQGSKLAFQSLTLRPQYRPKIVYKAYSSHSQGDGSKRHLVSPLLGRFAYNQHYQGGMFSTFNKSNLYPGIIRVDPEHKKVAVRTIPSFQLARSTFQPDRTLSAGNKRESNFITRPNKISCKSKILYETENHANSRTSQLDRSIRPPDKSSNVKNKSVAADIQKKIHRFEDSAIMGNEAKSSQMDIFPNNLPATGNCNPNTRHTGRCNVKRLGISDQSRRIQRKLRPLSNVLHQHSRTDGNMVCSITNNRETRCNKDSFRQQHSGVSNQKGNINGLSPTDDIRNNLEKSNKTSLEPINIPYKRSIQCSGRSTVKKHDHLNRMVVAPQGLSTTNSQGKQESSGGSFCNQSKSPTQNICFSVSRRRIRRYRCNENQLGKVGSPLSVSTDQYDIEDSCQIIRNTIQDSCSDNTRHRNTTLVHGPTTSGNSIESDTSETSTNSVQRTSEITQPYQTSRLEIIKAAYNKKFPNCNEAVKLMAAPLRGNSIRDYQHKWKTFLEFLNKCEIPFDKVTVSSVLRFFTYLFYEKHFKPGTVAHYRTALTVPLKEHFNIDLKIPAVADLLRAMWLQRPNIPTSAPAWSLNKVLSFIETLSIPLDETMLFRKTAFLLLLSTGWRVSELHACVRNAAYCRITENSTLYIRPHPSFLAKNEDPKRRWVHKEIRLLKLQDGSVSKLCPVTTLKEYLQLSPNRKTGDLLLTPGNHGKKLTIHQLSTHICQLIFQADNTTHSNVHDIRKYATSCALAETMLVGDLVSAINWSSPAIFYKFYLTHTEPLTRPVSLPIQKD